MNKMLVNEDEEKSPFSLWLKKYREQSGVSLVGLRDAIGGLCSDAYLSKLENDKYKGKKGNFMQPDEEIVEALAIALNRPIDEARVKANYAPKSKEALEILESVNFTMFNRNGIEAIKNLINSLPIIRPELLKLEDQPKDEILTDLGIAKPNVRQLPAPTDDAEYVGKSAFSPLKVVKPEKTPTQKMFDLEPKQATQKKEVKEKKKDENGNTVESPAVPGKKSIRQK